VISSSWSFLVQLFGWCAYAVDIDSFDQFWHSNIVARQTRKIIIKLVINQKKKKQTTYIQGNSPQKQNNSSHIPSTTRFD
jgi:ADP-glucose pyrophosphorylase